MQKILQAVQNYKSNKFLYLFAKDLVLFLWIALADILVNVIALIKTKKKLSIHGATITMVTKKIQNSGP